jgi:hypothetical protein
MLDKGGRSVFVVMDACYSGNSVRGVQSIYTLTERFMNLNEALASKGIVMDWSRDFPTAKYNDSTNDYPYKNIQLARYLPLPKHKSSLFLNQFQ